MSAAVDDVTQDAIGAWLAIHGGPRRFQRGESTDFFAVQYWLLRHGYALSAVQGSFIVRHEGRQKRFTRWRNVVELVDTLRMQLSLEPVMPQLA